MDTNHFKGKLETELKELEAELKHIGRKNFSDNPEHITDWEAKPSEMDIDTADDTELGDKIEDMEENSAVLKNLEMKYNDIKHALDKIEKGTYGLCETCELPIEKNRLEANPAARTCKTHMEQ